MRLKNKFYARRSLFRKYMNVSVLIVFFSFLVLGTILTLAISNYWTAEKLNVLDSRAENVAKFIKEDVSINQPITADATRTLTLNNVKEIDKFLNFFASEVGGDIAITDVSGRTQIAVNAIDSKPKYSSTVEEKNNGQNSGNDENQNSGEEEFEEEYTDGRIPLDERIAPEVIQETIEQGQYFSKTTLGGIYQTERYVAARAITYNNDRDVMGVVIVTTDASDVSIFTDMVLKIFILSAIASLGVSILAIGLFSYNLVKPLKQMAQAAKQFAKGEFSIRVSETSNDEIGELAVAFNNMAESLATAEGTRRSFVANVSHELKTPMTTIAGFIDGILDGTIPPEKHQYYLHIVADEVKRLSRLVHSMLNLSRIDNGELKINYKKFDLLSVLVTIIITFEQEIDKRNIDVRGLDKISPKNIYGDKDLIHQVVYNLIENAVKFTNEGGFIEFNITENSIQTDFSVKNSGTGIKKSEIPLVFDKFYKTDKSRSKDKKGLGLGLYLVRSIIRQHGGDITADSVYGEYTEFKFYIPKKNPNLKIK